MASGVKLEINEKECKKAINEAINNGLRLAMGELHAKIVRETPTGKGAGNGQLRNSWDFIIDEDEHEAIIGSPLEYAIFSEFGTGEHAVEGNGRKGGWWIPVGEGGIDEKTAEAYEWVKEYRKNGKLLAVFTYGQKPNRTMQKSYSQKRRKMQTLIEKSLKEAGVNFKPNKIIIKGDFK